MSQHGGGLAADTRCDLVGRDEVERLVRNFYRGAAMDDVLGPVFHAAGLDWNGHIERVTDFWSWQLLGQPGYEGHPLRAHEAVHARTPLSPTHVDRWLALFCDTVDDSFRGPTAEAAKVRASKMAAALERLLAGWGPPEGSGHAPTSVMLSPRR